MTKEKDDAFKSLKINEKKWGENLMRSGWTAFPSIILEKQHALGLDALDINIIMYLSTYWWTEDNKPHPSKSMIAEALQVTPRTIQRHIARLEGAGFMRREYRPDPVKGNKSNKYHFDGLIKAVEPFAQEKLADIEERKAIEKVKRSRKKPEIKPMKVA
jgi:DNA-binding transcriptional ArsR family regulator